MRGGQLNTWTEQKIGLCRLVLSIVLVVTAGACRTSSPPGAAHPTPTGPAENPAAGDQPAHTSAGEEDDAERSDEEEGDDPSSTARRSYGKFIRFELITKEPERAKRFYERLFGWQILDTKDDGDAVFSIDLDGRRIGRIRRHLDKRKLPLGWMSWMSVDDIDDAMRDIESNGGRILERPRRVRDERRALLLGPAGGVFGIAHVDDRDPPDDPPRDGEWIWAQLWLRQFEQATVFYTLLGKYTTFEYRFDGLRYRVLEGDGVPRAVLVSAPGSQPTRWLPVVKVADVDGVAKSAEALGGRVMTSPRSVEGLGRMAVLASPAGGVFGIVTPAVDDEPQVLD